MDKPVTTPTPIDPKGDGSFVGPDEYRHSKTTLLTKEEIEWFKFKSPNWEPQQKINIICDMAIAYLNVLEEKCQIAKQ